MIQIIKGDDITHHHKLVLDQVYMDQALITFEPATSRFTVAIYDYDSIEKLISYRVSELPYKTTFGLRLSVKWAAEFEMLLLSWLEDEDARGLTNDTPFLFTFRFKYPHEWDRPYHLLEFSNQVREYLNKFEGSKNSTLLSSDAFNYRFEIYIHNINLDGIISDEINRCVERVRNAFERVDSYLRASYRFRRATVEQDEETVVMTFDFPEEVRVPCEQYLQYFSQFLKDLGVDATSDFKREAGHLLFTVTPTDPQEALNKIRLALDMYIRLPASPATNISDIDEEIAVQRLIANIDHLKGQLRLARAELRASDATIEAQHLIIQQQRLLSGEIILDSIKDVTPKEGDKEDLLGGRISLKKYEGKFFDLDIPTIYRELKRLFSKKS